MNDKDTIYRQDAIDAMNQIFCHVEMISGRPVTKGERALFLDMRETIKALPSAQPKVAKDTNVPINDCISRQAAIDTLHMDTSIIPYKKAREYADATILEIRNRLEKLPSAQAETAKRIVGKSRNGMTLWYQCDMCNEPVDAQDSFCRGCGRRLTDG